jgi:hypothetical protein
MKDERFDEGSRQEQGFDRWDVNNRPKLKYLKEG